MCIKKTVIFAFSFSLFSFCYTFHLSKYSLFLESVVQMLLLSLHICTEREEKQPAPICVGVCIHTNALSYPLKQISKEMFITGGKLKRVNKGI